MVNMKINKPGRVWIPGDKGRWKPFLEFREIRKGLNRGKLEIVIEPAVKPKRIIVEKTAVKFYPTCKEGG